MEIMPDNLAYFPAYVPIKNDATKFAELLKTRYGFNQVSLLLDASRREILQSLRKLSEIVGKNEAISIKVDRAIAKIKTDGDNIIDRFVLGEITEAKAIANFRAKKYAV